MKSLAVSIVIIFMVRLSANGATGPSLVLTETSRTRLIDIIHKDTEADRLFKEIERSADGALGAKPNPIARIETEGKLAGDPAKIRTGRSLEDMGRLHALGFAYAVTQKPAYAQKVGEFVLAWAAVNHSAGDPIDDTNLESLIVAYDLTRATFSDEQRQTVDNYLREVADKETATGKRTTHTSVNNWNSHRIKITGLIAFLLDDPAMIQQTIEAYHKQIQDNLLADGSSIDFHERDALHYHEYDVTPLLTLAVTARNHKLDFYDYHSASGASLAGGLAFLVPFADGSQTHAEFVHSTVDFDRKRAAAGQAEYKAGRMYEPRSAVQTLEHGELFEPSLLPLILRLTNSQAKKYPSWQILLNDAAR